jgi:hypothetical protein
MGSRLMILVVGNVRFWLPPQMPFTKDGGVKAFTPNGTDNSLDVRQLPWGAWGRKHLFDTETFHSIAESLTLDAGAR